MISHKVIRSVDDLESLAEVWPALLQRSESNNAFLTWDWMTTWARTYVKNRPLLTVVIYNDARPVALAPFWIDRHRAGGVLPYRVLRFLGSGDVCSDYLDIIVDTQSRDSWVGELWKLLVGPLANEWDLLEYAFVRRDSRVLRCIRRLANDDDRCLTYEIRGLDTCPYMPLPQYPEELLAGFSSTRRYAVKHSRKELAKKGELQFRHCTDPGALPEELARLKELNSAVWRSRGQPGSFTSEEFHRFHLEFAQLALKQNRLHLCSLWAGENYLGTFYGFRHADVLYYYIMSVVQGTQNRVNTGDVLLTHVMEDAIRQGCREFDFLRGGEAYKYRWTDVERGLLTLLMYRRNSTATLVYVMRNLYRSVRVLGETVLRPTRTESKPNRSLPVLVLGSGITALGVIRGLGKAGLDVFQVSARPEWERWSRWRKAPAWTRLQGQHSKDGSVELSRLLKQPEVPSAVLIPCADSWSLAAAAIPSELKARFPSSQASAQTLETLVDKHRLYDLLSEIEVPHPKTIHGTDMEGLSKAQPGFFSEAFLKPRDSQAFYNHYGVKGFHVRSEGEARQRLAQTSEAGLEAVLQEYIPGPASQHFFVDGFVDLHGSTCGLFARQRLRMYPPDFGNSTYQVSIPLAQVDPCVRSLERLFRHTAYRGLFSAEFKYDTRDQLFKLLEVNVRAWWYVSFAERCGVPLVLMAYQDALGQPVTPVTSYKVGVHYVLPYFDLDSCRWLRQRGEVGAFEWTRTLFSAKHAALSWEDPMPSIMGLMGGAYHKLFPPPKSRVVKASTSSSPR